MRIFPGEASEINHAIDNRAGLICYCGLYREEAKVMVKSYFYIGAVCYLSGDGRLENNESDSRKNFQYLIHVITIISIR